MTFKTILHQHHRRRPAAPLQAGLLACLLAGLLAACTPAGLPRPAPESGPPPATAPAADWRAPYQQWQAAGQTVLRIDAQRSLITVLVRRGGPLARLGHDHVVAIRQFDGYVAPAHQRADFQFRLDQMTVDEADLRTQAGLTPQPSADAIAGTRHNMLARVLDADHFPLVHVHAVRGGDGQWQVEVTLHGVTRTLPVQARPEADGDGLRVRGDVTLKQTDFGLVPFAIMGGALAVQDELALRFDLRAH